MSENFFAVAARINAGVDTSMASESISDAKGPWTFTDQSGGFDFRTHPWNEVLRAGERERFKQDAIRHRDEALSRIVQCRLTGCSDTEIAHWIACMRFLENSFNIPRVIGDKDGSST